MTDKPEKTKKNFQPPHPFLVIFAVMLCAVILTHLVPLGRFEMREITYVVDGVQQTRMVVDPSTFRYVMDEKK